MSLKCLEFRLGHTCPFLLLLSFVFLKRGFLFPLLPLRHSVRLYSDNTKNLRYVCKQLVSSNLHAEGPCVIMNNHHVPLDIQGGQLLLLVLYRTAGCVFFVFVPLFILFPLVLLIVSSYFSRW